MIGTPVTAGSPSQNDVGPARDELERAIGEPGHALDQRTLLVYGTQTTVAMRLRLKASIVPT